MPTPLEYFSYMLNYQGIFCGPLVFYVDYMNWIDEKHVFARKVLSNGMSNGVHDSPVEVMPTPWVRYLGLLDFWSIIISKSIF